MWSLQGALALLVVAWLLQCVGTWVQIKRYRSAFRELSSGWADGWMGAGRGGRFPRAGAIALIVIAPDDTVRRVVVIAGRTVFAKAARLEGYEGLTLEALRAKTGDAGKDSVKLAIVAALDQVDTVRAKRVERETPGAMMVPAHA
ncbi:MULTISPECIES: transcriptional regulator GutM [unclassified Aureimonas]|uniref:transcriptional regulator GutM n=1 Tax=unclassified Aureimonas TaxID=2615206 RepID=UPI0009EA9C00|nr:MULTISPECIES: transcriptional regulator GutM [unclassified Aureimonas]